MRGNILLIDDDQLILNLLKSYLDHAGYKTSTCTDGYTALDELSKNNYDLAIMDISMPHMNGIQTLTKIRKIQKLVNLPVIMLTSSKDRDDVIKACALGVTDYVIKAPVEEDLLGRVERILSNTKASVLSVDSQSPEAHGTLQLDVTVKQISSSELILQGNIELPKGFKLSNFNLPLLKDINISITELAISTCSEISEGIFNYSISFAMLEKDHQQALSSWVKERL